MSSTGGRNKRTRNVRNVDAHDAPSLDRSIVDKRLDIIPAGRQLVRTPPSKTERVSYQINKADDSMISQVIKDEPCTQETAINSSCNGSSEVLERPNVKDERKSVRRSSLTAATATSGNADPETFIQGMQGYQWTDTDLEFVYQAKWKKKVQQLEQELSDVQNALKSTRQLRDVAVAAHEKMQEDLSKVSSRERVQEMSKEILHKSQSFIQLEGLDFKGLLARLKVSDVQCFTSEERANIRRLNKEVTKAQAVREKQEHITKDIDTCKVNVGHIQVNIQTLTADVAALESQMAVKEVAPLSAKPRQRVQRRPKPTTAPSLPKPSINASFSPKVSTDPKPTPSAPKASAAPKPPTARSAPKESTAPKTPTSQSAPKASTAPKPPTARSAPKESTAPKTPTSRSAPKASTAPKPPTARSAPKESTAPKTATSRSAPKASTAPKPPTARSAPKESTAPKTATSRSAPKESTAHKTATSRSAPRASAGSKATTAPTVPEGDVGGVRRSKRIAAKKDKCGIFSENTKSHKDI